MVTMEYAKFVLFMSCFHVCRGIVNAFTTIGAVAVAHATPLSEKMEPERRARIESAYHNKKQEWN